MAYEWFVFGGKGPILIFFSEGTDYISTGAYCKRTETLSGDFKTFVEDAKSNGKLVDYLLVNSFVSGTIYIALGTYAKWAVAPEYLLNAYAEGLRHFSSYRIIFSFNGDLKKMPDLPNMKLVRWAPQTAILNHPKTRVFISHGGMKRWGGF
jgi:hypothetical protein